MHVNDDDDVLIRNGDMQMSPSDSVTGDCARCFLCAEPLQKVMELFFLWSIPTVLQIDAFPPAGYFLQFKPEAGACCFSFETVRAFRSATAI